MYLFLFRLLYQLQQKDPRWYGYALPLIGWACFRTGALAQDHIEGLISSIISLNTPSSRDRPFILFKFTWSFFFQYITGEDNVFRAQ